MDVPPGHPGNVPASLTPIGCQTLLFAACFHDVGKLEELAMHPVTGDVFYTDRASTGHIFAGPTCCWAQPELNVPRELVERWTSSSWATRARKSGTRCGAFDAGRHHFVRGGLLRQPDRQHGDGAADCRRRGDDSLPRRAFNRHMYVAGAPERMEHNLSSIPIGRRRAEAPPEHQTNAGRGAPRPAFYVLRRLAGRRRTAAARPSRAPTTAPCRPQPAAACFP